MGKHIESLAGSYAGQMECAEGLRRGESCELRIYRGIATWRSCEEDAAPLSDDLGYRPERCIECRGEFVYPADILRYDNGCNGVAIVKLACGNCGWEDVVYMSVGSYERLAKVSQLGFMGLVGDLSNARWLEGLAEIARFAAALQADAILPEDF